MAARAAEHERQERRTARRRALSRATTGRLPRLVPVGRPTGTLARRRRIRMSLLLTLLFGLNLLTWILRPDWAARFGVLVVTVLAAPVLATMLFSRRSR